LIGEIQALSWNLYGSRDYAMHMQPFDDAVQARVDAAFVFGTRIGPPEHHPPLYLDEILLADALSLSQCARATGTRSRKSISDIFRSKQS
jgi:hypothetical protein